MKLKFIFVCVAAIKQKDTQINRLNSDLILYVIVFFETL